MTQILSNQDYVTALFVIGMYYALTGDDRSALASFEVGLAMFRSPTRVTISANN